MTITVNTIEGRKGSACNNDAFAVLANGADVLDIIPAQILPGKTRDDIRTLLPRPHRQPAAAGKSFAPPAMRWASPQPDKQVDERKRRRRFY